MLAPVLIEGAQHHFFFDVAHDLRPHADLLQGVYLLERGQKLPLQGRTVAGLLGLDPGLDGQSGAEIALDGLAQSRHVPLAFGRPARHVLVHQLSYHLLANAADGLGHILGTHEIRALLVDHAALIVGHVVVLEQLFAGVEVVLLHAPLGTFDLPGQHAAFDGLAGLHADPGHERFHARGVAEDAHQIVFQRQIEAARPRIALTAGPAAQLIVDTP